MGLNLNVNIGGESEEQKALATASTAALDACFTNEAGTVELNDFLMVAFFCSSDNQETRWGCMWDQWVVSQSVVLAQNTEKVNTLTNDQFTAFMTHVCNLLVRFSFNMGAPTNCVMTAGMASVTALQAGHVAKVTEAVFTKTPVAMTWAAVVAALAVQSKASDNNLDSMAGWRKTFCMSADGKTNMFTEVQMPTPVAPTGTDTTNTAPTGTGNTDPVQPDAGTTDPVQSEPTGGEPTA